MDSNDDVGGRLAVRDSCKGIINGDRPSAASLRKSFDMLNVFFASSSM